MSNDDNEGRSAIQATSDTARRRVDASERAPAVQKSAPGLLVEPVLAPLPALPLVSGVPPALPWDRGQIEL
jgi:hypothetical protein